MRWLGRWFWTPIRDGENWAQTLVRVAGNLLRSTATVVVLGFGGMLGASAAYSYLSDKAADEERSRLKVSVAHRDHSAFGSACDTGYPITINVRNETGKTLTAMTIELDAHERGTSTNLLDYQHRRIEWDLIVPSGYELTMCYTLPPKYAEMRISGAPSWYSIKLEDPKPWQNYDTQAHKIDESKS